jgi:hypothetical protein
MVMSEFELRRVIYGRVMLVHEGEKMPNQTHLDERNDVCISRS